MSELANNSRPAMLMMEVAGQMRAALTTVLQYASESTGDPESRRQTMAALQQLNALADRLESAAHAGDPPVLTKQDVREIVHEELVRCHLLAKGERG